MSRQINQVRLALPTGRALSGVLELLRQSGVGLVFEEGEHRPRVSIQGLDVKLCSQENIFEMLALGSRDLGFSGSVWFTELVPDAVEILDTGMDKGKVVVAAHPSVLTKGALPRRQLLIASELENITIRWIKERGIDGVYVRSHERPELFPPEDADCIIDKTVTGITLRQKGLKVVETLQESSTKLYASRLAMENPLRRRAIEGFVNRIRGVLDVHREVVFEVNVARDRLDSVIAIMDQVREKSVSRLQGGTLYSVRAEVPRSNLPALITELKRRVGAYMIVSPAIGREERNREERTKGDVKAGLAFPGLPLRDLSHFDS